MKNNKKQEKPVQVAVSSKGRPVRTLRGRWVSPLADSVSKLKSDFTDYRSSVALINAVARAQGAR